MLSPEASILAQICKLMGKDEATQKAAALDEVAHTLSQLLYGEQTALQLCGQLTNACKKMDRAHRVELSRARHEPKRMSLCISPKRRVGIERHT